MLIDTPGMRELGLVGTSDGMEATFSDIGAYSAQCRFPDCSHTQEPGCAVLAALHSGALSDDHYRNYIKLKRESEYHDRSYVENRRQDRAFGRFAKSVLKRMRD
jgi:ribosome biogenesis GTPase